MGTNYYLKSIRSGDLLHIGKSSAGWHFALHVYPEFEINCLEDWKPRLDAPFLATIEDEYGRSISMEQMLLIITDRQWQGNLVWTDKDYSDNHAEPGLNGLVRSKIDGIHCVSHGKGTWDCIVGDFS